MSTVYFNTTLWYKSYLLEFRNGTILQDAFTFSVPPQSEEFRFPQRINETKTFGGAVIDDYGNDMVQITLSGTTVNDSTRFIYKSTKGFTYKTGEGEIFMLRDLLKSYGKQANLKDKEVYLYALTGGLKVQSVNPKWWRVYPQELQIRRSKDNPMAYTYTLTLLGEPEGVSGTSALSSVLSTVATVASYVALAVQITETAIDLMGDILDTINTLKTIKEKISSYSDTLEYYINDYVDFRNGDYSSGTSTTEDKVALGDTTVASGMRYNYTLNDSVLAAFSDVLSACKELHEALQDEDLEISEDTLEIYQSEQDDIIDALNLQAMEVESAWLDAYAAFKKLVAVNDATIIPSDIDSDDTVTTVYGHIDYTAKATDTWDSLALQYYNDVSKSTLLQAYNKSITTELSAGDSIAIPVLSQNESVNTENEVYNSDGVLDNYGHDIKLDDNGNIATHLNDLAVTDGVSTLNQSIASRLATAINSRVRLEVYGIRNTAGQASGAAQSFITSSVQQTLLAEPRVKEVTSIEYTGAGDNLTVEADYIDINDQKQTFGGDI